MAAEIEISPSNSQGSSTHPPNHNHNQNPSLSPSSTLPSFPQDKEDSTAAMNTGATAPPQDNSNITHSHQCFTADEIAKYNKYEADYASYLRAKYFSDKDVYGGDIYDLTVKVGNETIKASRSSPTRSFAEPAQSVVDPGHVLASEVELPAPGAEPSPNIANGSITPVKKSS
ncbi:uncharacterized protein LOC110722248 isoform X2 [Chenopodium quinoa]|uniref:uncharacterized protein LOC110722248 isoform X2 n=1 Tax=Chenopodium quinoa TaxID=63459 RepID=UPI000B773604|nr:uncharacterized protein LOC110722248 isoform X2 [Chenopodium quinoa]